MTPSLFDFGYAEVLRVVQQCAPGGMPVWGDHSWPKLIVQRLESAGKRNSQKMATYRNCTLGGAMCGRLHERPVRGNLEGSLPKSPFRLGLREHYQSAAPLLGPKLDDAVAIGG